MQPYVLAHSHILSASFPATAAQHQTADRKLDISSRNWLRTKVGYLKQKQDPK